MSMRRHGKIAFAQFKEFSNHNNTASITQAVFMKQNLEDYDLILSSLKIGCIVTLRGEEYVTSTGVLSLSVVKCDITYIPNVGFPTEHFGIENENLKRRHRFLSCLYNDSVKTTFLKRFEIINNIRQFLISNSFIEFETPIMSSHASGALAKPFVTHYNAYETDFYLRIAPETFLKRILAGGFDNIFEIGKNFRNEGVDPSHLQEFTVVEWYSAFKNYKDNLELFKSMLDFLIKDKIVTFENVQLDFSNCQTLTYRECFEKYAPDFDPFCKENSEKSVDLVFKTRIRPNIVQPTFVIDYPSFMSPMAKRSDQDENICEQWQFIVNGWEIVKCYTELVDATLQRQLLEEQMQQKIKANNADDEFMELEEDFLYTMEYGIPQSSGVGVGIDRLVAILTNNSSLRDVVFFPAVL